jgi:hypothetical protein
VVLPAVISNLMSPFKNTFHFSVALPLVLLIAGCGLPTHAAGVPAMVFLADPQTLAASKAALASGDPTLQAALGQLLKEASAHLNQKPPSVTEKKQAPPSGDKHDYMSQAPYYWRDTNSPGAKYVRHDGERNPESNGDSDAGRLGSVCSGVHTLGLAYYFSGNEKYAAKATEFIRVFFLNPDTRMNPNLNFGQGIPGEVEGRPAGLISARGFADLVDGIGLLAGASSWTTDDQQKMAAWAADYFHWLTTSKIGLGENAASNNHGTHYDVQAVSLALFIGNTNYAREHLLAACAKRIAQQIEPDGRMPRELTRTLSFNYSLFNLRAEMNVADLGRAVGVDLWHYQTTDGRSILKAVEFMATYADPQRAWTYPQIRKANRADLGGLLLRAAAEFPESQPVKDALKLLKLEDGSPDRLYLKLAPAPG